MAPNNADQSDSNVELIVDYYSQQSPDFYFTLARNNKVKILSTHRALLSLLSPVFHEHFEGCWKYTDTAFIDRTVDIFVPFIGGFYRQTNGWTEENVRELLDLSIEYRAATLIDMCVSFMIPLISVTNAIDWMSFANTKNLPRLRDACEKFIARNTSDILPTKAFLRCELQMLKAILRIEPISCSEASLFDACISWAQRKCKKNHIEPTMTNVRSALGEAYKLIRFNEFDSASFSARRNQLKELLTTDQMLDIFEHINQNGVSANQRQLRALCESNDGAKFFFSFQQLGMVKFGYRRNDIVLFGVSRTVTLAAVDLSNLLIETTHSMDAYPHGSYGTVEVSRVDGSAGKEGLSRCDFTFGGDSQTISVKLSKKVILQRDQVYELSVAIVDAACRGYQYVTVYQMQEQSIDGTELMLFNRSNGNPHYIEPNKKFVRQTYPSASLKDRAIVSKLWLEKFDTNQFALLP